MSLTARSGITTERASQKATQINARQDNHSQESGFFRFLWFKSGKQRQKRVFLGGVCVSGGGIGEQQQQ
ncbi:hypothetical protein [Erwinia sp. V71]|uniref:hypothetical protein n=1 Tax=Erwinia sp. V71 TaxID=3369424 RepID=UPI003F62447D